MDRDEEIHDSCDDIFPEIAVSFTLAGSMFSIDQSTCNFNNHQGNIILNFYVFLESV